MSREAAFSALFETLTDAYAWGVASRRLKLWSDVPAAMRPALFQLEAGPETYQWTSLATPRRTVEAKLFLYFNSRDPLTPGATAINAALDAIDAAWRRRASTSPPAARRSAARSMTARSRVSRCATPATWTATGWRWWASGLCCREAGRASISAPTFNIGTEIASFFD